MTTDAQAALAQVREALAAGPTPREWLIAGEDKSFVYSLGPHGTNAFWAHVQAAGPERISEAEKGANAKLIAACSPENIAALLAEIDRLREQLSTALMDGHDMAKNEYRDEIERLTALLADRDEREAKIARERDEARAERDDLRGALHTCLWAMRQPLDGWKGDCERKAMDKANAALAQIEQERSK